MWSGCSWSALLLAGWYLNPESDDPARLYISFVLTATNYLILALALFISAFSLPADIKSKTIYTIVTKPVRATEIVLGRMLGFVAVGTMMLIPMGLASYLFVTRGLRHTHVEVTDVREVSGGGGSEGETDYVRYHKHTFFDRPRLGRSRLDRHRSRTSSRGHANSGRRVCDRATHRVLFVPVCPRMAKFSSTIAAAKRRKKGSTSEPSALLRVAMAVPESRVCSGCRVAVAKIQHGYVEGGTLGAAEFTFSDVTPARYRDGIPVDLSLAGLSVIQRRY